MKFIKLSVVIVIALSTYWIFSGNSGIKESVSEKLFCTNPHTSYHNIVKQGFTKVKVDVMLFEKNSNDTIIQVQMDDKLEVMHYQTWRIRLNSVDSSYLMDLLEDFDVTPINTVSLINLLEDNFCVMHLYDHTIFICNVELEQGIPYLNVKYSYPL